MDRLLSWAALKNVPGIGNHLFRRLIVRFGSPRAVFRATRTELLQVDGIAGRLADAIRQHRMTETVKNDLSLALDRGYRVVTQTEPEYPQLLLEIPDPPPFLYVYGRLEESIRNIAVVGSRKATRYGLTEAGWLSASLAALGMCIVSGMALGIDTAAHEGALDAGGRTVAVLGSGLERVYPARNRGLFHRIAENGAVVSEFPIHTAPEAHHFPLRNRVISGMALGTVVVEATGRSGSLITARLAAEQNREVFAVPGSIRSTRSAGTHALIKQGAKLVEQAGDVMEEFSHILGPVEAGEPAQGKKERQCPPVLSPDETSVVSALSPYPVHIDDLVRQLGMAPGKLSGILLQLELRGMVEQAPGKMFSLK